MNFHLLEKEYRFIEFCSYGDGFNFKLRVCEALHGYIETLITFVDSGTIKTLF